MKKLIIGAISVIALFLSAYAGAQTMIEPGGTYPYVISQPGSYKLAGNLSVRSSGVNAIVINASGVTVDLNGYAIIGPMVCTNTSCNTYAFSAGVYSLNSSNIIRNGAISGFYDCVYTLDHSIVNGLAISSCYDGIISGTQSILRQNTVANIYFIGIAANNSIVEENAVSGAQWGIYATSASVSRNLSTNNTVYGIYLSTSGLVANNMCIGNANDIVIGSAVVDQSNACTSGAC